MAPVVTVRRRQIVKIDAIKGPTRVHVGFPQGQAGGDVINRAIWNHYGTSRGIPSRPFLLNAIRRNRRKYLEALKTSVSRLIRGDTNLRTVMSKLGIVAQGDVQNEITTLRTPPNAPSTIRQKGSSNPLIDSGEMRAAVTWEVKS